MQLSKLFSWAILACLIGFLVMCTPKSMPQTTTTNTSINIPNNDTINSSSFEIGNEAGKWGKDSLKTREQYSLYREYYKQKLYSDALPYWKYVYDNAPALRKTTYLNGTKMYESFIKAANDSVIKQAYVDTLFMVYDQRITHFGEEGIVAAWQALKMKKYRPWDKDNYNNFVTKAIDIQQEEAEYFVVIPYFKLVINDLRDKTITFDEVEEQYARLSDINNYNINNDHPDSDKYADNQAKLDEIMEKIKPKSAPKPKTCAEIKTTYEAEFKANPNDVEAVKILFARLVRAKCKKEAFYHEVLVQYTQLSPSASRCKLIAQRYYNEGKLTKATELLQQALSLETDATKKASIYMSLASIERRNVSDLTPDAAKKAREYAKKAADLRPGWGKPYMFIGDLYASSGPLCGSGRGWNSQVVAWAATDMWEKAKDIDPSYTSEANKSINTYKKYYPTVADGHMRGGISNGQSYRIPCWINSTTRVRLNP
jgi:hypothetical protein